MPALQRYPTVARGACFGAWVVQAAIRTEATKNRMWLCRCSCGVEKPVYDGDLKRGTSLRCASCATKASRSVGNRTTRKTEIGDQYGPWTVIEHCEASLKNKAAFVICKCSCGDTRQFRAASLRNGKAGRCYSCERSNRKVEVEVKREQPPVRSIVLPVDPDEHELVPITVGDTVNTLSVGHVAQRGHHFVACMSCRWHGTVPTSGLRDGSAECQRCGAARAARRAIAA